MARWDSLCVYTECILSLLSLSAQSLKQDSRRDTHVRGAALQVGRMTLRGLKLLPTDRTIGDSRRQRKRRRFAFIQTPANEIILVLRPEIGLCV